MEESLKELFLKSLIWSLAPADPDSEAEPRSLHVVTSAPEMLTHGPFGSQRWLPASFMDRRAEGRDVK